MGELVDRFIALDDEEQIRCVVLGGSSAPSPRGPTSARWLRRARWRCTRRAASTAGTRFAAFPAPLVAAVSGFCLGGGNELAMACDLIVASETAQFGQPETGLGIIPGAGGTQRLRAIGKAKAMDVILSGRFLDAVEAERAGLVAPPSRRRRGSRRRRRSPARSPRKDRSRSASPRSRSTARTRPTLETGLDYERKALYLALRPRTPARA